ncbi:MAG TPA: FtsW/RodA/SpoVE family cell cycle protein, partial [Acidimicrobiales bacterium]|nr:FtsW/RodA/SpoVE family cell cycle protein [Acidimicrobiales bacterium]
MRGRRATELGLIILASLVICGAYALAALGRTASIPANVVPFLGVILGLLALAHVGMRRLAPNADGLLLPLAGLLNGIGYVFIARLDTRLAGLQSTWSALGVAAFLATLFIVRRTRDLERYRYTFALLGVGLLMMPLVPVLGRNINGARLWVRLGPITLQPGEFAKIALAIFFASYLVEKAEILSLANKVGPFYLPKLQPRHIGPLLLAWGFSLMVMTFERDLGSSLLFFTLFVSMLWVATARGAYLTIGFGLFAAGATMAASAFAHVASRVRIWLNPWPYAADQGYQLVQSLYAFGSGGLSGTGLSLGSPQKIPEIETDFIFAAIGEELGLIGTTAIVVAYLLMVGIGIRIALRAEAPFEKLLACGLTTILGLQT